MSIDDYFYGENIESLPPELARIVNEKEGYVAFEIIEPVIKRNEQYETYLNKASTEIIRNKNFKYTPKVQIKDYENIQKKESTRLYYGVSRKYNLDRYVYGRLFATAYQSKNSECYIIDVSSKIYSWANYLRGFEKNNYIYWFQIKNIDESHSMLSYAFNRKNIKLIYSSYLDAIAYCIDNK